MIEHPRPYGLTPREFQVLDGITRGESAKETARRMGIAPNTAKSMTLTLYKKMGVNSALKAATKAFRERIIEIDDPCEEGRS